MTNSESILQLGNNAYGKPATALNILRETIMGRELFDKAFKEYAERWAFKHPMPSDFFRTMEDASGVDLDWFWRGWFYGTEPCDIALKNVKYFTVDSQNPSVEKTKKKVAKEAEPLSISEQRNKTDIKEYLVDKHPELLDFYNTYDPLKVTENDKDKFKKYDESLTEEERKTLNANLNYYVLDFENVGGLVMPIILEMEYADGSKEMMRIPAEIWRKNNEKVSKLIITKKKVKQFSVDPLQETADINMNNNYYPAKEIESQFQLFKEQRQKEPNLMQLEKSGKL
jgi:aminopeptidase N